MQLQNEVNGFYKAVVNAATDAIIIIDDKGLIKHFSHSAELLFGYPSAECINNNISMLMPLPDKARHDGYLQRYQQTGEARIIGIGRNVQGQTKSGRIFPMHLSVGKAVVNAQLYFIGICHDLTKYQHVLTQLARIEARYKDIVEHQKELICRLDAEHRITFYNRSFINTLEHEQDYQTQLFTSLLAEGQQLFIKTMTQLQTAASNEEYNIKLVMNGKNQPVTVNWWFKKVAVSEEFSDEIQGFGIDISQQEAASLRAAYLQDYDALTGLMNTKTLIREFEHWHHHNTPYAVMYFDCQNFGLINQKYGHIAGDKLLLESATRFKNYLRQEHLTCRPGGDNLIMIVPCKSHEETLSLAKQLTECLQQPYLIENDLLYTSVRVGISMYPTDDTDIENLIRLAESTLSRHTKNNGAIAFFDVSYHQKLKRQLDIEQGLRQALMKNQLNIYLQTKVELKSQQTTGYEALLRWSDKKLGTVSPAEFIPIAERMNLGAELDRYVLKNVVRKLAGMQHSASKLLPVAVNITARHFSDKSLCEYIDKLSLEYQLPLSSLELEITESILMDTTGQALASLNELRKMGVKIAIDDFGTGYSSLGYLKDLAVDTLKIDKVFVDELSDPKGLKLVEAILAIAKALKMNVVAEGIETEQQYQLLLNLGCDMGQGYYFARPEPIQNIM